MIIPLADTSFVLAISNQRDSFHPVCRQLLRQYDRVYLPQSVLNEVAYMVTRDGQVSALINWLAGLSLSKYELLSLELEDLKRTAELLNEYAGTRLDFVDVTLVALAERLDIGEILTLDHRDFSIVRPRHRDHFDLLPAR